MLKKAAVLLTYALILSITVLIQALSAESYQNEGSAALIVKYFPDYSYDPDGYQCYLKLSATRYFDEVVTDGLPLKEATYLQQKEYLTLSGSKGVIKMNNGDFDYYGYGLEFMLKIPDNSFFIKLGSDGSMAYRHKYNGEYDECSRKIYTNNYKGEVGYYITDGLSTAFTYYRSDLIFEYEDKYYGSGYSDESEVANDQYGIYLKYLFKLSENRWLNIRGSYQKAKYVYDNDVVTSNNAIYSLAVDFYLTNWFSMGLGYELSKGDDDFTSGNTKKLEVCFFFIPEISITAGVELFESDDEWAEDKYTENFMLMVTGRF